MNHHMQARSEMTDGTGHHTPPMTPELKMLLWTIPMDSIGYALLAYIVTIVFCLGERALSYTLERFPYRYPVYRRQVAVRTGIYALSTALRYLIMLVVMSFHPGIFVTVVLSLAVGQGFIELMRANQESCAAGALTPLAPASGYRKVVPALHTSHDEEC